MSELVDALVERWRDHEPEDRGWPPRCTKCGRFYRWLLKDEWFQCPRCRRGSARRYARSLKRWRMGVSDE
jgi:hypothetical protein